MVREDK
jgi:hypothetical protein